MLLYILPIPSCSISGQWNGYVVHVQYIRACNIPVLYHLLLYPAVYVDLVFSCQVTETEGLVGRWKSFIGAEVSYTLIASCVLHHLHDRAVNNGYYPSVRMRHRVTVVVCVYVCSVRFYQTVTNRPGRPMDHLSAATT